MREFRRNEGTYRAWAPHGLQRRFGMPLTLDERLVGRVEVVIGRLGTGKTTFAVQRAIRLARCSGPAVDVGTGEVQVDAEGQALDCPICWDGYRDLFTTGQGWPGPWREVSSWESLFSLSHCVLVVDELHFLAPSISGLMTQQEVKRLLRFLSLLRKRHVCLVATTQAWTRIATHVRQLVDVVWLVERIKPGKVHTATAFDRPEDGGREVWSAVYFDPRDSRIPTSATAWAPFAEGAEVDGG